jgi:hypothetical protein
LVARTTDRYTKVPGSVAAGRSLRGISRDLNLDYYTVRRYARAESLDELLAPAIHRSTLLDDFKPYRLWRGSCGVSARRDCVLYGLW